MKSYFSKNDKNNTAFTLAEVLITLGIIGVVAALTLPTLIQSYKKQVLGTRIKKFASISAQATKMAEAEHGPAAYFDQLPDSAAPNEDRGTKTLEIYNKYYRKYIKTISQKVLDDGVAFGLPDGSGFIYYYDVKFCVEYKKCLNALEEAEKAGSTRPCLNLFADGKNVFMFHGITGIAYAYNWDGTEANLVNNKHFGCRENNLNPRRYCTKLLQLNGWDVPKDYPIKL